MTSFSPHVIVVTFESAGILDRCIQAVRAAGIHSITIADNGSVDDWKSIGEAHGAACINMNQNVGLARATNFAASQLPDDDRPLLLLNPDVILTMEALQGMQGILDTEPQAGVVTSRLLNNDYSSQFTGRRDPTIAALLANRTPFGRTTVGRRYADHHLYERVDVSDPEWVLGACMLVRRSVWKQLKGMHEGFFLYCEDVDLCLRARASGWSIRVDLESSILHDHARSSGGTLRFDRAATRHHYASLFRYFVRRWRGVYRSGHA